MTDKSNANCRPAQRSAATTAGAQLAVSRPTEDTRVLRAQRSEHGDDSRGESSGVSFLLHSYLVFLVLDTSGLWYPVLESLVDGVPPGVLLLAIELLGLAVLLYAVRYGPAILLRWWSA